jgi:hypothetical protein
VKGCHTACKLHHRDVLMLHVNRSLGLRVVPFHLHKTPGNIKQERFFNSADEIHEFNISWFN